MASAAAAQNPRPFSHALHLKLPAKFTCVSCHSSVQTSTRLEDNNLPAVAVCLGCHKEVAIGTLKPTNHTPDFIDAHNRKNANLDKASCAVCHGRKFTCLGCH